MFRSGSFFCDVSLTAFRLGSLFEISLFGVFHLGSFALDPRLQSFIWDLSFEIRRLVSCLRAADHIFQAHKGTRTNKLDANKTKQNAEQNQVFALGRFFPKRSSAAEGFLLVFYRIAFVHQDFSGSASAWALVPKPRYLAQSCQ